MRIESPLSNLSDTINKVKESAARYRETLQRNEAATRAVLIDPILQALGWDTANTYMVEVEKSLDQTRVDYALYDHNASVRLVVEAKALMSNLDDNSITMSIIRYAFTYKIQDIFLTDGLVWKHITNLQPGNMEINVIDFMSDNVVDCAVYLVQRLDAAKFWPEEQTIDLLAQRVAQLESSLATVELELSQLKSSQVVDTKPKKTDLVPTPIVNTLATQNTHASSSFVDLATVGDVTGTKPSLLRLPDGNIVKVSVWKDVLRECCKYALVNNHQIPVPFPDRSGRKVRLFDVVRPATGISSVQEQYNDRMIYIYLNYDANNCVANAIHVLKQVTAQAQTSKTAVVFA